ncbi:uncharacterized protein LOC110702697 [Chenopodium quinoa]|uniref:uncharacterized protein LOC110702697 n=1 Tax=Chenopodium quinoa TaxID=63459 RepID=UPI000B7946EA|nr:uncharacterized protein LOC110702697 [Chenopodium quinoa]
MIFQKVKPPPKFNYGMFMKSKWNVWLKFNLSQTQKWRAIFSMGMWHIWKLRNGGTNKGKGILLTERSASASILKWNPPRAGFLKLNTDGAWKNSDKYNSNSALAAELYALREGINYARAIPVQFLEVETDAQAIKGMMSKDTEDPHHELVALIIDVGRLLRNKDKDMTIIFNHIPREINYVAHYLSKYAMDMHIGHKPHYEIPASVRVAYDVDLRAMGVFASV